MRISDWSSDVCSSDLGQSRSACPECGRSGAGRGCPSRHACTCRKAAHLQPGTWHIAGHADRSCRADAGTGAGRRKMIGWLGETYLWVKAAHLIFVIFWVAGMFMLPRFFVYHPGVAPGSAADGLWIECERRLLRLIIRPERPRV